MNVTWLEHLLGEEWEIFPAGGATGDAYYAKQNDQKLFLKRNSSPFLAVLSAEGIVPKLLWTKRMENGDVITAQHWLNGRELKPKDMGVNRVARLLSKIHRSRELLDMLKRLGKQALTPCSIVQDIERTIEFEKLELPVFKEALIFLKKELPNVQFDEKVVCHCDVNHNNWLLSEADQLYLIDWDGAMIADPAIDIGMLLYSYIPEEQWEEWLLNYGMAMTPSLERRMFWYVLAQTIVSILFNRARNNLKETNEGLENLKALLGRRQ